MATKLAIAEAMGDQIRDVLTDVDWDFQVEHLMVINPSAICVDIYPGDPATDSEVASFADSLADMGAGFIFNVRARVSPNDHEAGQQVLYELSDPVSDISLVQALYDEPTLGGVAADVNLVSESGFTLFQDIDPSKVYFGILWRFLVIPARS